MRGDGERLVSLEGLDGGVRAFHPSDIRLLSDEPAGVGEGVTSLVTLVDGTQFEARGSVLSILGKLDAPEKP